jgi:hypothetical protein
VTAKFPSIGFSATVCVGYLDVFARFLDTGHDLSLMQNLFVGQLHSLSLIPALAAGHTFVCSSPDSVHEFADVLNSMTAVVGRIQDRPHVVVLSRGVVYCVFA